MKSKIMLSVLASVVLTMGLMLLPAYANAGVSASAVSGAVSQGDHEAEGDAASSGEVERSGMMFPALLSFGTSIRGASVSVYPYSFTYDGFLKEPSVTVTLNGKRLVQGVDYKVSYSRNRNAGNAEVRVSGYGDYTDSVERTFKINPASISSAVVTLIPDEYVYDGREKEPSVWVSLNDYPLFANSDYTVSYRNNKQVGTASVKLEGTGNYTGSTTATFRIVEPTNYWQGVVVPNPDQSGSFEPTPEKPEIVKPVGEETDLATYADKAKVAGFTDLDANEWYMGTSGGAFPGTSTLYLDYTIAKGLMSGYTGTTRFAPNDPLSRGMAATIIYRMATKATADTTNNNVEAGFPDVHPGDWYAAAVKWCSENGIVTGYQDGSGRFGPNDNVTREQLAAMIFRYCTKVAKMAGAGSDVTRFPDGNMIATWAREAAAFCAANGIITGKGDTGAFDPQGDATRCQMAKIIAVTARMLE